MAKSKRRTLRPGVRRAIEKLNSEDLEGCLRLTLAEVLKAFSENDYSRLYGRDLVALFEMYSSFDEANKSCPDNVIDIFVNSGKE